jgi:hypothetical protein
MTSRSQELRDAVRRHLEEMGINAVEFGHTGSCHQAAYFELEGRRVRYTFPGTPSDKRALKNTVRSLKRFIATPQRGAAAR